MSVVSLIMGSKKRAASADGADARRYERKPVSQPGYLQLAEKSRLQILVRNIDAGGACIELPKRMALPRELHLTFGRFDKIPAHVIWRKRTLVGLEFVRAPRR